MNGASRFFGGSPLAVILKLILLSVVVGVVLSLLGLSPYDLIDRAALLVQRLYNMGFGAIEWAVQYFLLGAVIVFPIWLILRLVRVGQGRN